MTSSIIYLLFVQSLAIIYLFSEQIFFFRLYSADVSLSKYILSKLKLTSMLLLYFYLDEHLSILTSLLNKFPFISEIFSFDRGGVTTF